MECPWSLSRVGFTLNGRKEGLDGQKTETIESFDTLVGGTKALDMGLIVGIEDEEGVGDVG